MMMSWLKVGELARRTGVSVRTLHYYEQLGLLRPSHRTESGHRLYGELEAARLLRIKALQHLGFELEAIARMLDGGDDAIIDLCAKRLASARAALEQERRRVVLLEKVSALLGTAPSLPTLITTIEALTMYEKHYTQEQLATLERRREAFTDEQMQEVQKEWEILFARVEELISEGASPDDARCAPLAARWRELVALFTGGDAGISSSLNNLWAQEGDELQQQHGYDPAVMEFAAKMQHAHPE